MGRAGSGVSGPKGKTGCEDVNTAVDEYKFLSSSSEHNIVGHSAWDLVRPFDK